jgi:hypothetical protein
MHVSEVLSGKEDGETRVSTKVGRGKNGEPAETIIRY